MKPPSAMPNVTQSADFLLWDKATDMTRKVLGPGEIQAAVKISQVGIKLKMIIELDIVITCIFEKDEEVVIDEYCIG